MRRTDEATAERYYRTFLGWGIAVQNGQLKFNFKAACYLQLSPCRYYRPCDLLRVTRWRICSMIRMCIVQTGHADTIGLRF
jgi:hypothetical protein